MTTFGTLGATRRRPAGAVLAAVAMLAGVAFGVSSSHVRTAEAADATPVDYECSYTFAGITIEVPFSLSGTVEPGPVAPGGDIHITDLTYTELFAAPQYIWITLNDGAEIELGPTQVGDDGSSGFPHSTTPIDVTIPAPATTGPYGVVPTSMRFAPFGYPPDNPEQFTLTCDTMTISPGPIGTVDVEEPTTTTSTTTSTTTTSTTTTTTTVPEPVDETVIDAEGIVSEGCEVSVPVHFAEAGEYTLAAVTEDGREIGSAAVSRDGPGDVTVVVTIDGDHGTAQGDVVSFVLTDADGNEVTRVDGSIDNPDACTPGNGNGEGNGNGGPLVDDGSGTPPAATPVPGSPTYTG